MKHVLMRIGVWLTEAAIAGAPMIPLFIFATSFVRHEGQFEYVLPFVLFYAFNKTGEYTLGMFGPVKSPCRIAHVASVMTMAGAIICLFGNLSVLFFDAGAVLVGFGTSVFGPMYRAIRGRLREEGKYPYAHGDLMGYAIMVAFSVVILLTHGYVEEVIIGCYVVLSAVASLTLWRLVPGSDYKGKPMFDYSEHDFKKGIPALLLLALVFFVRLFRQTANALDIVAVLVLATVIMVFVAFRRRYRQRQTFEFHGIFYSEVVVLMVLYDIVWYISQGDVHAALMVNLLRFTGQFLGLAFGRALLRKFRHLKQSDVIIAAVLAISILFALPASWFPTNFVCLLLVTFLSQVGHIRISGLYRKRGHLELNDLFVTTQKMNAIGTIAGQVLLVAVLSLSSLVFLHDGSTAISAYALHHVREGMDLTFFVTRLVCLGIIWIQGIALLLLAKHRRGRVFKARPECEDTPDGQALSGCDAESGTKEDAAHGDAPEGSLGKSGKDAPGNGAHVDKKVRPSARS